MQKFGWFGGQGSPRAIGNIAIRQSTYDFLFDFNRNYASILYRFRVIARFLSKVTNFNPPHLHLSPPQGVILFEFRRELWCQKTRVNGLSCGVICVILRLAVLIQYRSVTHTHTHTDRQTDTRRRHIPRLARRRTVKTSCSHPVLPLHVVFQAIVANKPLIVRFGLRLRKFLSFLYIGLTPCTVAGNDPNIT